MTICIKRFLLLLSLLLTNVIYATAETPDFWKNATVYFMLTDRFNNGDSSNDSMYNRTEEAALLRGFLGGDIKGITQKIEEGYFSRLGVDALWMTPLIEQVHGYDESAALTYSYHGYWPKDWTSVDANFGSEEDIKVMITTARAHGIKVLFDVILNHTGPETKSDWAWPQQWVRTRPVCNWQSFEQNTRCALATSLTDIKTEISHDVHLPPELLAKWQKEGRLTTEMAELDAFFKRTGYPRAPKYYLIKWLTDWVREYGIDGFRVDTAKHVEPDIWRVLKRESDLAFNAWKMNHPEQVTDHLPFYMVGEVFNWGVDGFKDAVPDSRAYNYGDKQVDFFQYGFDALINMGFVEHVKQPTETLFQQYSATLSDGVLQDKGIVNYIGSHDDHHSYDMARENTYEAAFKLMLSPGAVQIYYGDELARPMHVEGALGDANMRAFMNWQDLEKTSTQSLLQHWQRLGQFRSNNIAVGAGSHSKLNDSPYIFKRELQGQKSVLVASSLTSGSKTVSVYDVFGEGESVYDYYSEQWLIIKNGKVTLNSPYTYLLLGSKVSGPKPF